MARPIPPVAPVTTATRPCKALTANGALKDVSMRSAYLFFRSATFARPCQMTASRLIDAANSFAEIVGGTIMFCPSILAWTSGVCCAR
ncbi:hypothetical protein D3C87_1968530 [compost metagenome]